MFNKNINYTFFITISYINVSFRAIKDILQYFMPVIKNNIQRPPSAIDIDITREER